ncbi:MAG: RrF2 family transcriptional regulator [Chloroflexi bacterium]|nr:RrF2 family transcriptional regulator [Chloroflexota bacterium]
MRLSMRSDYGARAVIDLARHYGQGPIQSAEIAARQVIPETYLEQLLTALRKAGLIRSTRGPNGGHELARAPAEVRLSEVIVALEGPLLPLDCLEDADACPVAPTCGMRDVWGEVMAATNRILADTTIENLVERQKARESRVMYYI